MAEKARPDLLYVVVWEDEEGDDHEEPFDSAAEANARADEVDDKWAWVSTRLA